MAAAIVSAVSAARAQPQPDRPARVAGRPNFNGIWNSATATPLERPPQLKDKPFYTPDEAAAFEQQVAGRNQGTGTGTGTYNTFFREFGTRTVKTLRTSIITDPPDGRIPPLTPAAAAVKQRRLAGRHGR